MLLSKVWQWIGNKIWLFIALFCAGMVSAFAYLIVPYLFYHFAEPVYSIEINGDNNVILGQSVTIRLVGLEKNNDSGTFMPGYTCDQPAVTFADGSPIPSGLIQRSDTGPCTFVLWDDPQLYSAARSAPLTLNVMMGGSDQRGRQFHTSSRALRFHKIKAPTIKISDNQGMVSGQKQYVSVYIEDDGEQVKPTFCAWKPSDYFDPLPNSCDATFTAPARGDLDASGVVKVWAEVTLQTDDHAKFDVRSRDVNILILPMLLKQASTPEQDDLVLSQSLPEPLTKKFSDSVDKKTIKQVIVALNNERESDRYQALHNAISQIDPTVQISASDAIALLGPISGLFRREAIETWILPRMVKPFAVNDMVQLFSASQDFDRAEMLGKAADCIKRPISEQELDELLNGLRGSAWHEIRSRFVNVRGSCDVRKAIQN